MVESSFVHVTFDPLLIVNDDGLNAMFFIDTAFWLAVLVCGADDGLLGPYEVHPAVKTTMPTSAANPKSMSFFIFSPSHAQRAL